MEDASNSFADFVSSLQFDSIPRTMVDNLKVHLLDTLGVILGGSASAVSNAVFRIFQPMGGKAEAMVIGYQTMLPCLCAAFVNGTSAHSIEMDDGMAGTQVHPGACVVPAALALAQREKANPKEFLAAILAGYETMLRLGLSLFPHHRRRGFHPTGTCGIFGAAAASARLLKLDSKATADALGYAGTQATALREGVGVGAFMMKRIHAGKAAHNGVLAALLAREGLEAPHTILEGNSGFLKLFAERYDRSVLLEGLGEEFVSERGYIKPYPSCRHAHAPIESMLFLRKTHQIKPGDVKNVTVRIYKEGVMSCAEKSPVSITDAQFSIPYNLAVSLIDGQALMEQFLDQRINAPEVRSLAQKVDVVFDADLDSEFTKTKKRAHVVQIKTWDGRVFERRTDYPKGSFENPMNEEELSQKFNNLASVRCDGKHRERLIRFIHTMEEQKGLEGLWEILAACGPQ